jgi:hypothetical protein
MSGDALRRARQALAVANAPRTQPSTVDPAKVDDLLARARAAASGEAPKAAPPPVQQAPAPRVEKVRLQMTCSATGQPFVSIAERRGDELMRVANEVPQAGHGRGAPAEHLSGAYWIGNAAGWACPHCGSSDSGWTCECADFPNALHCGGLRGRARYCACGKLEDRHLVDVGPIKVRGQSIAATPQSQSARLGGPMNVPAIRGR